MSIGSAENQEESHDDPVYMADLAETCLLSEEQSLNIRRAQRNAAFLARFNSMDTGSDFSFLKKAFF